MEKAPERIWLQWNPENDSDYTWTGEGVTWCDEQIHASDIEYVRANAQPDAPEAMTMPDDVRAAIRQALEFCAGDYCMTGDRYDHFEVALAWLDAQPEAPETVPEDVRERLAAVQHEIWAHWMRYLFDVCETDDTRDGRVVIIPADKVKRWQRQMNTPYVDLTDREQESDRHQADKILAALDVSAAWMG